MDQGKFALKNQDEGGISRNLNKRRINPSSSRIVNGGEWLVVFS